MSKRVNAIIPDEYFSLIEHSDKSITDSINDSLTFYFENKDEYVNLKNEYSILKDENLKLIDAKSMLSDHNETLKKEVELLKQELEFSRRDKETIQGLYDNYMRQMQTLIQQKAIEAPGQKKWWKFW
jgi:maltodextrin utilization protein YvdJ